MDVLIWKNDDIGYNKWVFENQNGFIANFKFKDNSYCVLHKANHNLADRSKKTTLNPRTGNYYYKVTSNDINELLEWIVSKNSNFYKDKIFCKKCKIERDLVYNIKLSDNFEQYINDIYFILNFTKPERPRAKKIPNLVINSSKGRYRDPRVGAWVMYRASGHCELCEREAPFFKRNELPYLEVHHIVMLSNGGEDTPKNTAALCPNCHRFLHHACNTEIEAKRLADKIILKEDNF